MSIEELKDRRRRIYAEVISLKEQRDSLKEELVELNKHIEEKKNQITQPKSQENIEVENLRELISGLEKEYSDLLKKKNRLQTEVSK